MYSGCYSYHCSKAGLLSKDVVDKWIICLMLTRLLMFVCHNKKQCSYYLRRISEIVHTLYLKCLVLVSADSLVSLAEQ